MKAGMSLEAILLAIFLLGIVVEAFYIVPVILFSETEFDVIFNRIFDAGIIISTLLILVIILIRQKHMMETISSMMAGTHQPAAKAASQKDVKKELLALYRDKGALKIVYQDGLIQKDEFERKMAEIDKYIEEKKKLLTGTGKQAKKD